MRITLPCFVLIFLVALWLVVSAMTDGAATVSAVQPKTLGGKATPAERIKIAKDFKVELLYSVPRQTQGSWVSMCTLPDGRLIVSDQGGAGLFRVTPPALNGKPAETRVERLPVEISGAQGLLWAFDSLYVMVNGGAGKKGKPARPNGLYRVRASKPGGELDEVQQLRTLAGGGEHGPHAILLAPDGKALYVVCGNDTRLTQLSGSLVPKLWGEDRLFPILANFGGVVPPAGWIARVDPDGKEWLLVSAGYRNEYDAAFNRHGDLFTYDSDMEWDMNMPWYRPTRVSLAASGSDHGFRNGSNNSPPRNLDNLPPILNIGPGSPTGVTFGYGAKFPAKYQEVFYICDWSYGILYAVHLTPEGSAYKAQAEEFALGSPLPLTDIVINPKDGAMYFTIGGRNTQSALYRVTYTGKDSTAPSRGNPAPPLLAKRRQLEAFHGRQHPKAVDTAWPFLGHPDRYLRFAARVAVEHQHPKEWQERAVTETNPAAALNALLALARVASKDPTQRKAVILAALDRIDWTQLSDPQRSDLLRVHTVLFSRLGPPDEGARDRFVKRFSPVFPTKSYEVDADLCQLLVYVEAPGVAGKALQLMAKAPSQEEQMEYAKSLRNLKSGWTPAQRKEYFEWFLKAANYKGGNLFRQSVTRIKQDALATLTDKEKEELKPVLEAKPLAPAEVFKPRPFVKQWTVADLVPIVEKGLSKRDFERGRVLFAETKCYACHRFQTEGGAGGPDLTGAAGRFSVHDLLEAILEPSKVISDQYASSVFTLTNGRQITGRIINLHGDGWTVNTDMMDPGANTKVNASQVDTIVTSPVSPMPAGLIDTLTADEILDLTAFLLSRGDRKHKMFQK